MKFKRDCWMWLSFQLFKLAAISNNSNERNFWITYIVIINYLKPICQYYLTKIMAILIVLSHKNYVFCIHPRQPSSTLSVACNNRSRLIVKTLWYLINVNISFICWWLKFLCINFLNWLKWRKYSKIKKSTNSSLFTF